MASEPVKRDKFTLIYGLWAGALLLLYASGHYLDLFFNLYVLLVPLLLVPTIVVAVGLLASLERRQAAMAALCIGCSGPHDCGGDFLVRRLHGYYSRSNTL